MEGEGGEGKEEERGKEGGDVEWPKFSDNFELF